MSVFASQITRHMRLFELMRQETVASEAQDRARASDPSLSTLGRLQSEAVASLSRTS